MPTRSIPRTADAASLALVVLGVASCSAGWPELAEIGSELHDANALMSNTAAGEIEPSSVRFLGEHEGTQGFVARPARPGSQRGACLLVQQTDAFVASSCSTDNPLMLRVDGIGYALSETSPGDGWINAGDWFWIEE